MIKNVRKSWEYDTVSMTVELYDRLSTLDTLSDLSSMVESLYDYLANKTTYENWDSLPRFIRVKGGQCEEEITTLGVSISRESSWRYHRVTQLHNVMSKIECDPEYEDGDKDLRKAFKLLTEVDKILVAKEKQNENV